MTPVLLSENEMATPVVYVVQLVTPEKVGAILSMMNVLFAVVPVLPAVSMAITVRLYMPFPVLKYIPVAVVPVEYIWVPPL